MISRINSLSVIIPIFNEEKRLINSLKKIKKFIRNKKIEIIFVNDGSTDLSQKTIQTFVKDNKKTKIINLKKNIGKGGALKEGIKIAKYKWILTLDLDLSVPITEILLWFKNKYINNKYSVYFGSRSNKKSKVRSKIYRNIFEELREFKIIKLTIAKQA